MLAKAGFLLIPLVLAAISAAFAMGAQPYLKLSDQQIILLGFSIFCLLTALGVYAWMIRHMRSVRRRMDDYFALESDLLARIHSIEKQSAETEARLLAQLAALEEGRHGGLPEVDRPDDKPAVRSEPIPRMENTAPDGNVVPLNLPAKHAVSPNAGGASVSRKRGATLKIGQALNEGPISIRLQPILNLIEKEVIALEAFAFLRVGEAFVDGRDFIGRMTGAQQNLYDYRVMQELSSVVRAMEQDEQTLPIHYGFVSMTSPADANWLKLTQTLKGDPKMVANIVPVIPQGDFRNMNSKAFEKLLGLRECGLKPCLGQVTNIENVTDPETLKHFQTFKSSANTLLNYRKNDKERFADQLVFSLAKTDATIFVSDIGEAHQASQLIDLDLVAGQGEYVSPVKSIRLYKDIEATCSEETASGTADTTG